jgi:prepilin-type N-terminal cleavage/methylation domain-containing protein
MRQVSSSRGFTLVEMMIVILIIAVIMAIAIPNIMHAREAASAKSCIANLHRIDQAKEQFAMESGKKTGDAVEWSDLVPVYIKSRPSCPLAPTYTLGLIGANPTCPVVGHDLP